MLEQSLQKLSQLARSRERSLKMLIVDDEPMVRETFEEFCHLAKCIEVDTARDGDEAIRLMGTNAYDLITVDLIMPELSGLDVLMEARKVVPETPLMLVTGNATDKLVYEAGLMGACRVIYKPVDLELFISEVATVIGERQSDRTK